MAAVLAVGVVAALTALPGQNPAPSRNMDLGDNLRLLRTAIFRFSMDHDAGDGTLWPGANGADVAAQLTQNTRIDGTTAPSTDGPDDRYIEAYLEFVPRNPVNGFDTIRSVSGEQPPALTGQAGWVYQFQTGRIYPDLPGSDPRGVPYVDY